MGGQPSSRESLNPRWIQWTLCLLFSACESQAPQADPDELQPTEACPLGEAQTIEEAEVRAAEVVQCLGHEQVDIDCDVATQWFYLDEMTTNDNGWTIGADTLSCQVRLGEKETVYPFRVDEHRIPPGYWSSDEPNLRDPDPLDINDPDAQHCRQEFPQFLPNEDLEEVIQNEERWIMCGRHRAADFDLYCWGPIHNSSEFPVNIVFLCRIDSYLYRSSFLSFRFVGPGPVRPASP